MKSLILMATLATFTVPQSVFNIGSSNFGSFSIPAGATFANAQVNRSLLITDSGGAEIVNIKFQISLDVGNSWNDLFSFGLATGSLLNIGFSGGQHFIPPNSLLRGTLTTTAPVSCPLIITITDDPLPTRFSPDIPASVAFDANATAPTVMNAVTSATSTALTVGVGTQRAVIAAVNFGWATTAPTTITCKWDNAGTPVTMGLIVTGDSTQPTRSQLYGLVNPVSGAKTLAVAWTNSADVIFNATSFSSVDQTGGATSFPNSNSATGNSQSPAVTITSAIGNYTISTSSEDLDNYASTGNTQTFLNNTGTHVSSAGERAVGAATVSHTYQLATNPGPWVAVGTDILAFGAGVANPFVTNMLDMEANRTYQGVQRTHLDQTRLNLIGKDKFFGVAGQTQTYDYPNPKFALRLPNSFSDSFKLELIGKDVFFGGAGQGPNYDWPALANRKPQPLTHTDNLKLELISQDKFFGLAGNPLFDQPNPHQSPFILKTFSDSFKLELIGQDQFFGIAGNPLLDQPLPKNAQFISHSYSDSFKLELIGQDALPVGYKELGAIVARNKPQIDFILNLLNNTLGVIVPPPSPFFLTEWPVPQGLLKDLKTGNYESQIQLFGQDFVLKPNYDYPNPSIRKYPLTDFLNDLLNTTLGIIPPVATPFSLLDYPLPANHIAVVDLKTWTVNLLQTTLKPVIPPGTSPQLILVEGRLAKKVSGIFYIFLD